MENVKNTNKRSASSDDASQDKKLKISSTDAALLTGSSRNRLKSLVLPARKKKTATPAIDLKSLLIKETEKKECNCHSIFICDLENTHTYYIDYECPLCADIIYPPYPPKLKRLLKKVQENNQQYEKEMRQAYEKQVALDQAEGRSSMPFVFEPTGISLNDKKLICRTHRIELIFKPMAIEKGYPTDIDFDAISDRIKGFEDDLKSIVDRVYPSTYLSTAMKRFEELGLRARRAEEVMKQFEDHLVKMTFCLIWKLIFFFMDSQVIMVTKVQMPS
jgi:hypothetical protein